MSRVPAGVDEDELHMTARRVLLDALYALRDHQAALTVVGAQAVYLRTTASTIRSAAFTSDGDISIDPAVLGDDPHLEEAMAAAGFSLKPHQSGLWQRPEQVGAITVELEVDLLVPHLLAPRPNSRRSTELPPHDAMATRKVPGLEVAAVDRSLMTIGSLTPTDPREIQTYVAGPAALLIAKAIKLSERIQDAVTRPHRLSAKDAADIYRIMTLFPPHQVASTFATLRAHPRVGEVAEEGIKHLTVLFGGHATPGTDLAVQALAGDVPESRIRDLTRTYLDGLTTRLRSHASPQ